MVATASLLYRMGIEGDEQVKAAIAAVGTTEEQTAARAVAAADRKADRVAAVERQLAALRAQSADADSKALAIITGNSAQYEAAKRRETAAEQTSNRERARTTVSVGQLRAGTQQLSYQIGDVAQQFALGTPPMVIFAQQGGQVIQAIQLMTGSSKGLIGFLGGPWGAVITGGAMILATLAAKYLDSSDAAKAKAEAAKQLIEQMDRLHESTARQIKSEQQLRQETLNTAYAMWQKAEATRQALVELLKQEKATFQSARSQNFGAAGGAGAGMAQSLYAGRVEEIDRAIAANSKVLDKTWETVQQARIPILRALAEETDAATASTRRFERAVEALDKRFLSNVGRVGGAEYQREYGRLKAVHDAEQEALTKREQKRRGLTDAERAARKSEREAIKDARELAREFEALEAKFDPAAAALRRYNEQLETINRLRSAGKITPEQAATYSAGNDREYQQSQLGWQVIESAAKSKRAEEEQRQQRIDQAIKGRLADQADAMELAERELMLAGSTDQMRAMQIDKLRYIQALRRDGITDEHEIYAQLMSQNDALIAMEDQLRKNAEYTQIVRDVGGRFIEDVLNPKNWDDWGEAGKRILESLLQDMMLLALVNPLKNAAFGTDLPTMSGLFSAFGSGGIPGFGSLSFATGTHYFGGGAAMVGERGPEMALFPRGTRIVPANDTAKMMGGAPMSVHIDASIHAPGADPAALARVEEQQRQMMAEFPRIALEAVADAQQRMRRPLGLAA